MSSLFLRHLVRLDGAQSRFSQTTPSLAVTPGENLSEAFPSWLRLAYDGVVYRPFDMNMPPSVPRRSPAQIEVDPPLTEHGQVVSQLAGKAIRLAGIHPLSIISGPEYRCIQTAAGIAKLLESYILVEEGLQSWNQLLDSPLQPLHPRDFSQLGLPVIEFYKSFRKRDEIRPSESFKIFSNRIQTVNSHILNHFEGSIVVVADSAVILQLTRGSFSQPKDLLEARSKTRPCQMEAFQWTEGGQLEQVKDLLISVTPTYSQAQEDIERSKQ